MSAFSTAVTGARGSNRSQLTQGNSSSVVKALGDIAHYLPSEGIALYVAGRSLLSPIGETWPAFVALIAALALNVFIVATTYPAAAKAENNYSPGRHAIQVIATVVLTLVYVAALVGNPLDLLVGWQFLLLFTGFVALVVAAFLPSLAPRIGLVPRS